MGGGASGRTSAPADTRDDRTAHHRMRVADGRAPHGGPRSDATLCAHTDDGTLGNARELHAEQQARRSA